MAIPEIDDALEWAYRRIAEPQPGQNVEMSPTWPESVMAHEQAHGQDFDALAERLLEHRRNHRQVILLASCLGAENRTTLVLGLARAIARPGERALVVDADLGKPMLASALRLQPRLGLAEVVAANHLLPGALIVLGSEDLALLPTCAPVPRPRRLLSSPGWTCLMARLRRQFGPILLDGGPVFAGLSAAVLHRSVDGAVLLHDPGHSDEAGLERALEVLDAAAIPVLSFAQSRGELCAPVLKSRREEPPCTRRISA